MYMYYISLDGQDQNLDDEALWQNILFMDDEALWHYAPLTIDFKIPKQNNAAN